MPTVGDGPNHFYRLIELDWALRHGVFYPRWMPDMGYGYGMPVFVYYPPLAYYVAEVFRLIGFTFANAMLAAYALALGLAAVGAFSWGRDVFGETGGFVAAAAYAFAPYLYLNVLARGALPEALALGLLPWLFWAYRRFALSSGRTTFFVAVLLHTAFILTHTLSALVATPLVTTYVVLFAARPGAQGAASNQQSAIGIRQSHKSLFVASLFIPLLLSAFFWLPALFETRYVQAGQLFIPALDFHNHFLTLGTLLAAPRPFDPKLVFFDFPASLGWPQIGLAAIGLGLVLYRAYTRLLPSITGTDDNEHATHLVGAWLALVALAFLTHPASARIWETLPLLRYLQFPWRLVGPASLMLAIAAGGGAESISSIIRSRARSLATTKHTFEIRDLGFGVWGFALLSFWLFSLPWTFTAGYENLGRPTIADIARYEQDTGHLGTTSAGEYLPVGVTELPAPDSLAARYAESLIISRLDRASLPHDAVVVAETSDLNRAETTIDSATSFTATFDWFYFPGWQAEIDGKPASIAAREPNGLIAVDVPAGHHTVGIHFGSTPLRQASDSISLLTLIGTVLWGVKHRKREEGRGKMSDSALIPARFLLPTSFLIALLLFRSLYLDRFPSPFSNTPFDGATVAGVTTPLSVNFDHRLALIGLDLPDATVRSGDAFDFDLYWRPLDAPLDADYS
ncbi:MAG: hypothetical protein HY260_09315, partial [Chloroflexi bacterium]|nr:hypothetical protein [Chloroflexota bacterium]